MRKTVAALALIPVTMTAIPIFRNDAWWVRIFDFPRVQIALILLAFLIALLAMRPKFNSFPGFAATLVGLALIGQAIEIGPFTPLWPNQMTEAKGGQPTLKLLTANVLMDNREADDLHAYIESQDADLILLTEPDAWWEDQMRRHEAEYPHVLRRPLDNTYGMLLYSRLPLIEPNVREMFEEDVPSFHFFVDVGGQRVRMHLIHPKPPFPKESDDTTDRDAEIVLVGKMVRDESGPAIVMGDFNDVAWSYSTGLFQEISGLMDPRLGRGFYHTFHADYFFARWPLDYVFATDHFRLVSLERLGGVGSDHFPLVAELELAPAPDPDNADPEADADELKQADEVIDKGGEK